MISSTIWKIKSFTKYFLKKKRTPIQFLFLTVKTNLFCVKPKIKDELTSIPNFVQTVKCKNTKFLFYRVAAGQAYKKKRMCGTVLIFKSTVCCFCTSIFSHIEIKKFWMFSSVAVPVESWRWRRINWREAGRRGACAWVTRRLVPSPDSSIVTTSSSSRLLKMKQVQLCLQQHSVSVPA